MSSIDEIKTRINIVDLVSETVQLRRAGKSYTGFCPFHSNTRTPAFVVFPETGTWRCFGQCNEGGDIFRYVMKKEGWDFSQALTYLAEKAGVQLRPVTPQERSAADEHERLRELLEEAVNFFRHNLLNTPPGQQALEYLHARGLKDEIIEAFGLGYAPHSWDACLKHLIGRGFSEKDLLEAGMVSARDSGGIYDRFRHRITFPIRNEQGLMAGFGARILNPEDVPKFLNSPQTDLFDKSRLLYGLDRARRDIRARDQVVLVEGYLDVIALHQAGYANAVSPMGTALTEQQLYLIKRYTRRIILALDPDAAGAKATLRGLQIARQALDRESDPVFDARGLLSHEARLQADIRVTTLPDGMDPDEVVNRDPAEWERILAEAKPVITHVMETLAAGQNLDDPKVKSSIARQVIPLIEDIANSIERETYRQRLARLLRVDERALLSGTPDQRPTKPRRTSRFQNSTRPKGASTTSSVQNAEALGSTSPGTLLEAHCLGVLMRRPDMLYRVDRAMLEHRLPRISWQDFQRSEHQAIFQLIIESLDQNMDEPLNFVLNGLSFPMMDKADELLKRTENMDPVEERVLEDLVRTILSMREHFVHEGLDFCRYLQQELYSTQAQETDADRPAAAAAITLDKNTVADLNKQVKEYSQALRNINQALGRYTNRTLATRSSQ